MLIHLINMLLEKAVQGGRSAVKQSPEVVIMAPTAETAKEIYRETCRLSRNSCLMKCAIVYIASIHKMTKLRFEMQKGCNILVATPKRLKEFTRPGFDRELSSWISRPLSPRQSCFVACPLASSVGHGEDNATLVDALHFFVSRLNFTLLIAFWICFRTNGRHWFFLPPFPIPFKSWRQPSWTTTTFSWIFEKMMKGKRRSRKNRCSGDTTPRKCQIDDFLRHAFWPLWGKGLISTIQINQNCFARFELVPLYLFLVSKRNCLVIKQKVVI